MDGTATVCRKPCIQKQISLATELWCCDPDLLVAQLKKLISPVTHEKST